MSHKQTVYRLTERKGFDYIKEFQEDIPKIDKHEVLVKIREVALNYRDIVVANGEYPFPVKHNVVPISDAAGEVVEVGSEVKSLHIGDKVITLLDPTHQYGTQRDWNHGQGGPVDGVLLQFKAYPEHALVKLPHDTHLTWGEAASLVITGATSWNSLYGGIPFVAGQTILFQGTGGVSITGLILAKAAGAVTIVTSSSDEKLKIVQEKYGADYVINYRTNPDWDTKALEITKGEGVDHIFENGGINTIVKSINSLKRGGTISVIGFLAAKEKTETQDFLLGAIGKAAVIRGIINGSKQLIEDLVKFVHAKKLRLPVDRTFEFKLVEIKKAYDYVAKQQHIGKVTIKIQ